MAEDLQGDRLRIVIAALEKRLEKQSSDLERVNERLKDEIAKRKRTEALLRECREIFYSFMRHLPALAFIKNIEGKYVYLNEAYKKILKINPAEHIGKTDDDIWPPEAAKQLKANDSRVMFEGKVVNAVETLKLGNKLQQFLTVRFPIFKNGKPFFLGGILIELTGNEEKVRGQGSGVRGSTPDPSPLTPHLIPDSMPGLNIQEGIRRIGGSRKLYAELLISFCTEKKNFVREFQEFIKKKNWEAALISAHALKGSSAMISATELSSAAKILEAACNNKENEAQIMAHLKPVEESLNRLINLCENLPGQENQRSDKSPEPDANRTQDLSILSNLFKRLEKSFQELDPSESECCIRDIRNCFDVYPPGTEIETLFRDMVKQAGSYNFDEAGEILGRLSQKIRFLPH